MTDARTCPCGKPTPNAYLCRDCVQRLERDLHTIETLWPDTLDALTRRTAFGNGAKGKGAENPLPVDMHASEVRDDVQAIVQSWLRDMAGDRIPEDVHDVPSACRWLSTWLSGLLLLPQITDMADELSERARKVRRLVDRPEAPVYLGAHACGADVWARSREMYQTCAGCEEVLDVERLRQEAGDQARAAWATVRTITQAASLYGVRITKQQISAWYNGGYLQAAYADDGKTLTFNVGRVVDLARLAEQRRTA